MVNWLSYLQTWTPLPQNNSKESFAPPSNTGESSSKKEKSGTVDQSVKSCGESPPGSCVQALKSQQNRWFNLEEL